MIAIVDYGAGNLQSVKKAFDFLKINSIITDEYKAIEKADKIVIPGVGAFSDVMKIMNEKNLTNIIKEMAKTKKILGICLGMQMLFSKGYEFIECNGLNLIDGKVTKINDFGYKIPHTGWSDISILNETPLLNGINTGDYFYFVHSYKVETSDKFINAYCDYGERIPAVVSNGNVYGAQLHPEKSSELGLKILENFSNL